MDQDGGNYLHCLIKTLARGPQFLVDGGLYHVPWYGPLLLLSVALMVWLCSGDVGLRISGSIHGIFILYFLQGV